MLMLVKKLKSLLLSRNTSFIMEISGSFGDLGTLLPILLSLAQKNQINLQFSLFFAGLFNILSGYYFQIPICVQPMKAIAASALTLNLSLNQVIASGTIVSLMLLVIGFFRIAELVNRLVPYPIVKGIQLGTGLQLMKKAIDACLKKGLKLYGKEFRYTENWYLVFFIFFIFVTFYNSNKIPVCLLSILLGFTIAAVFMFINMNSSFKYKFITLEKFSIPSLDDYRVGISTAFGQLWLTLFNSVIALSLLAKELFPEKENQVKNPNHISIAVGAMNLFSCIFGCMPYCHGSGGLAAQYRFGARTQYSMYFLGTVKMLIALIGGNIIQLMISHIPTFIISNLLFFSGIELARNTMKYSNNNNFDTTEQSETLKDDFLFFLITTGTLIGFSNAAYGVLAGLTTYFCFKLGKKTDKPQNQDIDNNPYIMG